MSTIPMQDPAVLAFGLLGARLLLGLGLASHGAQKLFGWFGGPGLEGTGGFFEGLGFRPGRLFAAAAGLGELAGGLLTATGFLGPIGPAIMILVMLVAILSVHLPNGFYASDNGVELPLMIVAGALALAVTGPGLLSVDALVGFQGLWAPWIAWVSLGAAVGLALLNVSVGRSAPTKRAAA